MIPQETLAIVLQWLHQHAAMPYERQGAFMKIRAGSPESAVTLNIFEDV